MQDRNKTEILLIGGSAGSISVLLEILPHLNNQLSFPIVIVLHRKAYRESTMDTLLGFYSVLPVNEAYDKMALQKSCIYIAPADYHLLFENKEQIALDVSEKINYSRPSIDITFQSAAQVFKEHTTALLLSGANNDGMEGMRFIADHGGTVLVQDPNTAEFDYMPKQSIKNTDVNEVLKPKNMADFINHLA
ncbi:chemotaxis protein CheB [Niabella ginsengisoli]|uniref:protein-glutamate methylesterase n=1 Tax=Niabella ginsengisoli TaxID=522298 RepID=A0ABS9SIR8_9BACT|nr:chemotaxis protein CheB [Niabella ginsengisoli]MCH5598261.1 chemotaxis protein CheB [Niabella ginsengisoli]